MERSRDVEHSQNIRFRNVHSYSNSRWFDTTVHDRTHDVEIRQRESHCGANFAVLVRMKNSGALEVA
jgi:hypothetical protein